MAAAEGRREGDPMNGERGWEKAMAGVKAAVIREAEEPVTLAVFTSSDGSVVVEVRQGETSFRIQGPAVRLDLTLCGPEAEFHGGERELGALVKLAREEAKRRGQAAMEAVR
jgi:hypothetical protein